MRGGLTHLALACVAALLLLAGCGGESTSSSTEAEAPPPPTRTLSAEEQARADARATRRSQIEIERTLVPNPWREPGPTAPHDKPLTRLIVKEVHRGSGPALRGDERVYANYVKTFWTSGRKFLTAWGPLRAAYMDLASETPGITRGMIGMRVGGRRTIAMPRWISDTHPPDGSSGFVDAHVDIVLRGIVELPNE